MHGAQALAAWFRELLDAIPDFRMQIENTVDDGDRQCVVQWRATGTFTGGPFYGINPTGKRVELQGVDVLGSTPTARWTRTPSTTTAPISPARSGCSRRVTRRSTAAC